MTQIGMSVMSHLSQVTVGNRRVVPTQLHLSPFMSSSSTISRGTPAVQLTRNALPALTAVRKVIVQVAKPSNAAGDDSNLPADNRAHASPAQSSIPESAPQLPAASTADSVASEATISSGSTAPSEPASDGSSAAAAGIADVGGSASVPAAPSVTGSGGGGGVRGAASAGGGGGGGGQAVALLTRFNGVGYTFVLAGFLKIVTIGGLTLGSPVDVGRTAFGKASPYLMVPVGLGLCWIAKQIVDSGLNESKKFLRYMVAVLVLLYFGLVKLMYRYEPDSEWVRRPRARMPGPMAELRAEAGDKDLLSGYGSLADSKSYLPERPDKELYDDLAWYEGRYPSQLGQPGEGQTRSRAAAAARMSARAAAAAASDTEVAYGDVDGLDELIRSRAADVGRPAAAKVVNKRTYLSDNTR